MTFSRRCFVRFGQTLLAAAVFPARMFGVRPSAFLNEAGARHLFTKPRFLPLVNSTFSVLGDAGARSWLTLSAVEDFDFAAPDYVVPMAVLPKSQAIRPQRFESFALRFFGTGEELTQDTYQLENDAAGRFDLFLVPSGQSQYVAVINRQL